jgi:NADH:ubiquinone oxidoreductase subunit H
MLLSLLQKNFLVIHLGSIFLMMLIPTLLAVAFLTLVERKILAATQRRVGPNFVGFVGLLQPFADAAKLTAKEVILPIAGNKLSFSYAPIALFSPSLSAFFHYRGDLINCF